MTLIEAREKAGPEGAAECPCGKNGKPFCAVRFGVSADLQLVPLLCAVGDQWVVTRTTPEKWVLCISKIGVYVVNHPGIHGGNDHERCRHVTVQAVPESEGK